MILTQIVDLFNLDGSNFFERKINLIRFLNSTINRYLSKIL